MAKIKHAELIDDEAPLHLRKGVMRMNTSETKEREKADKVCASCGILLNESEPDICTKFEDILTPEEEQVFRMLRSLKEQARDLRKKMRQLGQILTLEPLAKPAEASSPKEKERGKARDAILREWKACTQQLEELRKIWKEWENRRDEAHHRKMVLLGHHPGKDNSR